MPQSELDEISAEKIEPGDINISFDPANAEFVDLPLYRDLVTRQNYTTLSIFQNEKIPRKTDPETRWLENRS